MKKIFNFSFLLFSIALLYACGSNTVSSDLKDAISASANRSMAKSMNFKSVAAFQNGVTDLSLEKLEALNNQNISLVVFYDSNAEWANVFNSGIYEKTGDEKFNQLLTEFNLVIAEQSEFDEMTEMLVLEANEKLNQPADAAKEISKIDGVLMVHLKAEKTETTETAVK